MLDIRGNRELLTKQPEVLESRKERSHTVQWIAIGSLAAALGGLCWFSGPALSGGPAALAQLPRLQSALDRLSGRMSGLEAKFKNWSSSQQGLEAHVVKLEKDTAARFQTARKQVEAVRNDVGREVRAEVAAQTQDLDGRLTKVESLSAAGRDGVEKLEAELTVLRETSLRQAEDLGNARSDLEREKAIRNEQLTSLTERLANETQRAAELATKLEVRRVEFELSRNRSLEIADGITLDITREDVSHRRVSGWMWLAEDRRAIWLRGQAAQEPVVFYGCQDGKRRELVITNVVKDSVTGYLLLPGEETKTASAPLAADSLSKVD